MIKPWRSYKHIIAWDFEFQVKEGNRPTPFCYCSLDLKTGEEIRHWIIPGETKPLFPIDDDSLLVGFFSSAEFGCHLSLGFPLPNHTIDLYAECRNLTNGRAMGRKLIDYCNYFGIHTTTLENKNYWHHRFQQGGFFSDSEKIAGLEYNMDDVRMTANLFEKIEKQIDKFALLRGKYSACIARMEHRGVPIDMELFSELDSCWPIIKEELIWPVNEKNNVFDEEGHFKIGKLIQLIQERGYVWEGTASGQPRTDNEYFSMQAKIYPELKPLQELLYALNQLKLKNIHVGEDGRNRTLISPYSSVTGRNQPSSSHSVFLVSVWLRGLIKPPVGIALSHIDFSAEEIGIAAALSNDENLKRDLSSGDPYLLIGKKLGLIPKKGTKKTHSEQREVCKILMLGPNYGMTPYGFAQRAKIPLVYAYEYTRNLEHNYPQFYKWRENFVDNGLLSGFSHTSQGWYLNTRFLKKVNTLLNWPVQSSGSDLLRYSIILCEENDVEVIFPIHDAIMIQAPEELIEEKTKIAQSCMSHASKFLLGFPLKTEATIIRYPDRYRDEKGRGDLMWNSVTAILKNMNPVEKQARIFERINENIPLEDFEISPHFDDNLSNKKRGQLMMRPATFSEKAMVDRIKKQGKFSHMEIMHLVRAARDQDVDIESEIDWENDSYKIAMEKIRKKPMTFQ